MSRFPRLLAVVILSAFCASTLSAGTFNVTSNADSGPGTLRQAILDADTGVCTMPCTVTFAAPMLIDLLSTITINADQVIIDGFSAGGSANTATFPSPDNAVRNVIIDGPGSTCGCAGFVLAGDNTIMRGLAIRNFAYGVRITGSFNALAGNYIQGNASYGVEVQLGTVTDNNSIGGAAPADRNIISGNGSAGVIVYGGPQFTMIDGNFIGTTATGASAEPNSTGIFNFTAGTMIGTSQGNLIDGNTFDGISSSGANTLIENNLIGTTGLGNGGSGVVAQSNGTRILNNSIRNNVDDGVAADGFGITGVLVEGNIFGGNGGIGVDLQAATNFDGTNANDATDSDSGCCNNQMNSPTVNAAYYDPSSNQVWADIALNTTGSANGSVSLQLYKAEGSAAGSEGVEFVERQCWGTLISERVNFIAGSIVEGASIVMLATGHSDTNCTSGLIGDGTSEFSAPAVVTTLPGVVTNTNDAGAGSLRQAILDANSGLCTDGSGNCAIKFAIPNTDPNFDGTAWTIRPLTPLPTITRAGLDIDGSTQSSFAGDTNPAGPEIVISGTLAGATSGLRVQPIGPTGPDVDNVNIYELVINGFANSAVLFQGLGSTALSRNNGIFDSYIGTDATGTTAVPNGNGVAFSSFSTNNRAGLGVILPASTIVAKSSTTGVALGSGGNLISGNLGAGILIQDSSSNDVRGNSIGMTPGGAPLPNSIGVDIAGLSQDNVIGGDTSLAQQNTIAFNGTGIAVAATAVGNRFQENNIFGSGALGIDLGADGVTPNDAGDIDTGANNLQNFPVITTQTESAGITTVAGSLNGFSNTSYTIEFFDNVAPDPSGHGEGQFYLDSLLVMTDGTGAATFSHNLSGTYRWVSTTATLIPSSGSPETSEFSAVFNTAPDAVDDLPLGAAATSTVSAVPVTYAVTSNDSDADGDAFSISTFDATSVNGGTVSCTATDCTYTSLPTFSGTDTFTYTISDPAGATDTATVTITVIAPNLAPVANDDAATTLSNQAVTTDVLANDSDPEAAPLSITSHTQGVNGIVTCVAPNCTYTPNANFVGSDFYTYTISDGSLSDTATVSVTVNNRNPVATDDSAATTSGTAVVTNVLANDSDPEGHAFSIIGSTNGANGSVICSTPNCTYTPSPTFVGVDTYTYTIQDSLGLTDTATVTVTVAAVNQPPVAVNDSASTTPGGSVTFNVLSNDSDPDGDPLTLSVAFSPSQGTVSCSPSGVCTYTASPTASGTDSFDYKVTDNNGGFDDGTVIITITAACPSAPTLMTPGDAATGVPTSGTMSWSGSGFFEVFFGPAGQGCSMSQASTPNTSFHYSSLQPDTEYEWRVVASDSTCPAESSACQRFRTVQTCTTAAPTPLSPLGGASVSSPIAFTWTPVSGATGYRVFASTSGTDVLLGETATTSLIASLPDSSSSWYVIALQVPGCGDLRSSTTSFLVCNAPNPPLASVVGESTSGQTYTVSWAGVSGASRYEVIEATNPEFVDAVSFATTETFMTFTKTNIERATGFYYQVRAFSDCFHGFGGSSPTIRVVVVPIPPLNEPNTNANAPVGSTLPITLEIFVPGEPGQTLRFTATGDKPWMRVTPDSGTITEDGLTFLVTVDPRDLPNGTFTGTVIVTMTDLSAGHAVANGTTTKSTPVSINLVTPITPTRSGQPTASSLIIPAVGHLDGSDAKWRSDIRVSNTTASLARYLLTFTPGNPAQGVKQTSIEVEPGATAALDDIIRAWYGVGSLGESSNGTLEVRPLSAGSNAVAKGELPDVSLATVVSSRTYAQTSGGTLGEFIPGVLFSRFIGAVEEGELQPVLNLQQIAQNQLYRTNVGVVEASGHPVSTMLSVFNSAGDHLTDIPVNLQPNEQKQLNSILSQHGITLNDGRIEVHVTGGEGRVTAYAAVIDNRTKDQLFVPASTLGQILSSRYVMPGIADLKTGNALWRSDMRLFNSGTESQVATLTLHPLNNDSAPLTASVTVQPNEVKVLDNIIQSVFGASGIGGAVHVDTPSLSSLVVTARTYNQTTNGTLGLFIPAVTPDEAVGLSQRSLNVVQAEESIRYRTNVGIAEVTGNPVTVELMVHLPDSKVTPRIQIPMEANEFKQLSVLRELGIGNVYNARISMKVIEGNGRITAYGSVVDMKTNDSTYVPAQ